MTDPVYVRSDVPSFGARATGEAFRASAHRAPASTSSECSRPPARDAPARRISRMPELGLPLWSPSEAPSQSNPTKIPRVRFFVSIGTVPDHVDKSPFRESSEGDFVVLGLAHCDTFGKGLGQGQPLGTRRSAAPAGSVVEVHWAWKWVRQQARHEVDCRLRGPEHPNAGGAGLAERPRQTLVHESRASSSSCTSVRAGRGRPLDRPG